MINWAFQGRKSAQTSRRENFFLEIYLSACKSVKPVSITYQKCERGFITFTFSVPPFATMPYATSCLTCIEPCEEQKCVNVLCAREFEIKQLKWIEL